MAPPSTQPRRRRCCRVRVRWRVMLVLLVLLGVGGGWLWVAIGGTPEWYQPADASDTRTIDLGHSTQNSVVTQLTKVRETDEPWKFKLQQEEANAWLAVNLPDWFAHQSGRPWPDGLRPPSVSIKGGAIVLGAALPGPMGNRIVGLTLRPQIVDSPHPGLRLRTDRVSVGNVGVPGSLTGVVADLVRDAFGAGTTGADVDAISDVLLGRQTLDPVLTLQDGRTVQLLDVAVGEGFLVFTCKTLSAADSDREVNDDG